MHLGVLFLGEGAYAAAGAGVLCELERRRIEPYAVCGLGMGAWIAAQHLCGAGAEEISAALSQAARRGRRLFPVRHTAHALMRGEEKWLSDGMPVNRLLKLQTGERLLALCGRRGIFPCRLSCTGRRVVFSSHAYLQPQDVSLSMQATVGFAARAAMGNPPFIAALPWTGGYLLPERDAAFAARQLMLLGADCVLIVSPCARPAHEPDAMELAAAAHAGGDGGQLPRCAGVLRVDMPLDAGALSFGAMERIARAGEAAAREKMDAALGSMGMTLCRVLSFSRRAQAVTGRR